MICFVCITGRGDKIQKPLLQIRAPDARSSEEPGLVDLQSQILARAQPPGRSSPATPRGTPHPHSSPHCLHCRPAHQLQRPQNSQCPDCSTHHAPHSSSPALRRSVARMRIAAGLSRKLGGPTSRLLPGPSALLEGLLSSAEACRLNPPPNPLDACLLFLPQ